MPRVVPRTQSTKKFTKTNFRLPKTATALAQEYNIKPKSNWQRWRWQLFLIGLLAAIFLFTYSGLFKIRNVIIDNVSSPAAAATIRTVVQGVIKQPRLLVLPQDNLALFSTGLAANALREQMYITEVKFDKHWPNVLRVVINEDVVAGMVEAAGSYYLIDKRGVAISQVVDVSQEASAAKILDKDLTTVTIGQIIMSPQLAQFVQSLAMDWQRRNLPPLASIVYTDAELPKLVVQTEAGWGAYLSYREDITLQLNSLEALLAESEGIFDASQLEYVDLRYGNKLYYKLKP